MTRTLALPMMALLLVACAGRRLPSEGGRSSAGAPAGETDELPSIWRLGAPWTLTLVDERGEILRTLTVEFTGLDAESCTAGAWKQVRVLSERPRLHPGWPRRSTYRLEGSGIVLDLNGGYCDIGHVLRGRVGSLGMRGTHHASSPTDGRRLGSFFGAPVTD